MCEKCEFKLTFILEKEFESLDDAVKYSMKLEKNISECSGEDFQFIGVQKRVGCYHGDEF